jgi:hypothetical protein
VWRWSLERASARPTPEFERDLNLKGETPSQAANISPDPPIAMGCLERCHIDGYCRSWQSNGGVDDIAVRSRRAWPLGRACELIEANSLANGISAALPHRSANSFH